MPGRAKSACQSRRVVSRLGGARTLLATGRIAAPTWPGSPADSGPESRQAEAKTSEPGEPRQAESPRRWSAAVHIERNELAELLRSRGNDQTAVRAEQSLPQHIDLQRDRETLRQCGIDPNVLAYILSTLDRTTDVTEPPSQPAADLDDSGGGSARVDGAPRRVRAKNGPSGPGPRTAVEVTNVSQRSLQSPSSSDHRADRMTTRSTSATMERAGFGVTPKPAIRCPRCRFVFDSPAPMLDHLNAHHRNADRLTHQSAESDGGRHRSRGAHLAPAPTADPVMAHLELAYRRSREFLDPRRLVIGFIILAYLLSICIVAILT